MGGHMGVDCVGMVLTWRYPDTGTMPAMQDFFSNFSHWTSTGKGVEGKSGLLLCGWVLYRRPPSSN